MCTGTRRGLGRVCSLFLFSICFTSVYCISPFNVVTIGDIDEPGDGMYTQVRIPSNETQLPLVSYLDAGCGRLKATQCNNAECSNRTINIVDGACNNIDTGRFESQIIGSDGFPFFAYYENFALKTAHCGDLYCSEASLIVRNIIDNVTSDLDSTGHYTALSIAHDGTPLIAFYNSLTESLNVASCDDIECNSSVVTIIDNRGSTGGYPSIATGNDGFPVLAFYEEGRAVLQFARCGDLKCRDKFQVRIETLDNSSRDVGRYNYIRIGSDGYPIIMYVDEVNGWMKVAHCSSSNCAPGTVQTSVIDEIGISAYGEFPEMQINPMNGLAVLSYFNQTNSSSSSVKVAQCLDISCTQALVQILGIGNCGYGRDSSLAFGTKAPFYLYVSFMNYSPLTYFRKASLAVLTQQISDSEIENSSDVYFSSTKRFSRLAGLLANIPRDIDDICTLNIPGSSK